MLRRPQTEAGSRAGRAPGWLAGPEHRWRQPIPDLLLWGLLFSSFTCPWVCTVAGWATSKVQKGRLRKAAAGADAGNQCSTGAHGRGLLCRGAWCSEWGLGYFLKRPPGTQGAQQGQGAHRRGTSVAVPLALLLPGGVGRPLSCIPTVPLPGDGFLAFRLSREPVWTACSTMGLLPTGADGKPAPELGRG